MFCGKCGKQIRDNSKFCEFCGAPVMPVPTKTKTGQDPVTSAGKGEAPPSIPASAPTSPSAAGTPLAVTPAGASAEKKKKTKTVVLVCVVGASAVLAAGGMWWKMRDAENASDLPYARSETAANQQYNALMEENIEETAEVVLEEAEAFSESEAAQAELEAVEESDLAEYSDAEEIETLESEAGTEVSDWEAESESDWDSAGEYILPECDTRLYTIEELSALSLEELRLARNELYARHGRIFQTEDLSDYFSEKTWYTPRYTVEEMNAMGDSFLNAYEKENRNRILQAESAQKGERPMQVVNCQESITLRSAPSVTAAELCQIPLGAVVVYKGASEGTFYQVEYEGVIGYAIGTYFAELY